MRADIKNATLKREEAYQTCNVFQPEIDLLQWTLEESKGCDNESSHSSTVENSEKENKHAECMTADKYHSNDLK